LGWSEHGAPRGSCQGWGCWGGSMCCLLIARAPPLLVPYPKAPQESLEGDQGSFLGTQAILQLSMGDVCIQRLTLGPGVLENEDE